MKVSGQQNLVPQIEEDIEELRWVSKDELKNYMSNTFNNIIDVIEQYLTQQHTSIKKMKDDDLK